MSAISTETTATLARLDHALSVQGAMPVADAEWMPGDPLWERPRGMFYQEQVSRPMVDLLHDDHELYADGDPVGVWVPERWCDPCAVGWSGREGCWVCGAGERPERGLLREDDPRRAVRAFDPAPRSDWVVALDEMQRAMVQAAYNTVPALVRIGQALASLAPPLDSHHPKPLPINGHEYARRRKARR
jgi:hypothetical protein